MERPLLLLLAFAGYGPIRHYFPSPGRQLTDRAGARHGNLTPPRISPSCPHRLWLWLGRSIITGLPARVGQDSCESRRNAKQPATGCFMDGWEPLCTLFGRL